ncbi:hypothetical protein EXIGLDRAFT_724861 [Exidia glandulosa HHB12029]|uniref:DUF6593 domain-containing protein n=1 Tax=Exidia glandulosa HHB12029 TaxID=1314781 RepID=A0A165E999_EXIGL|nr:hypothetical protein EXIGLDRAFT_724861 [Exidia glandulosa HHB12029]
MELAFTGCGPLNAVVASKNDEISYSIRTAYSLSKMSTTIFHTRDGGRVALIEWPAFGPNLLTLGEERVSPSSSSSSSSIRHDGTLYTWLDVPFKSLRLVADGEKVPIAVLTECPSKKTRLSISTEGLVSVNSDTILVTALIMLHKRRQRRKKRHAASAGGP